MSVKNCKFKDNKRTIRNRAYIWDQYLKGQCVDCGISNPLVLSFDHKDPALKKAKVSTLVNKGASLEAIKAEIKKCEIRCHNCHHLKTARDYKYYRNHIDWDDPKEEAKYADPWLTISENEV